MTTPIDDLLPRSCVLQIPDRVDYRRPNLKSGTLYVPPGASLIQVLWQGDAALRIFADGGQGSFIGDWGHNIYLHAQRSGQYPPMRLVTDVPSSVGIQAKSISTEDLLRHIAVNIYPLPTSY